MMTPEDLRAWAPAISAVTGQVVVGVIAAVYARLGAKRSKAILEQLLGDVLPRLAARPEVHLRTDVVDLPPDEPHTAAAPAPDPLPDPLPQPPVPAEPAPQPAPVVTRTSDPRDVPTLTPAARHGAHEAPEVQGPGLDTRAIWTQLGDDA